MPTDAGTDATENGDAADLFKKMAGNIAKSYYTAYMQHRRIEDLDKALGLMRELLVDLESGRFDYVNITGQMLRLRFEALDEPDDIDQSVLHFREAISLLPAVDEHRRSACAHMVHTGLATTYSSRFRAFSNIEDLERSISHYAVAVDLGPQSDGNYTNSVSGLASSLVTRFEHLGNVDDLQTAVTLIRLSLTLLDEDDVQRISLTLTLANTLSQCSDQSGDLDELEEAIKLYRAVIAVRASSGHPGVVLAIGNLASAHHSRYERMNEIEDLNSAIYLHETALTLLAEENPSRASALNNLGNALMTRFGRMGGRPDLEKSLECYRDALALRGPGNPDRPTALISMGQGLFKSFIDTGRIEFLDDGINHYREALTLVPEGHRHQSVVLQNLATLLGNRFEFLGKRRDLEEALQFSRQNLESRPIGDASRPSALGATAGILLQRFHSFGIVEDLTQAAAYQLEALELCPAEHSKRPSYIYDLGCSLSSVYTISKDPKALEAALVNHTLALSLRPEGHASRAQSLEALADVYSAHFERFGRMEDLDAAISWDRDALSLRLLSSHPRRFLSFNSLAVDLCTRFDQLGEMADLKEAIERFTEAKDSMPETAPCQSRLDRHLAIAYLKQHDAEPSAALLAKAFRHFETGFSHAAAESGEAVMTLLDWAAAARTHGTRVPLAAYSRALALYDQTMGEIVTVDMQQKLLAAALAPRTLAMDAAAVAIEDGRLDAAVELLEQGRAILWTRLRGYRGSLERLHDVDDALAVRFEKVAKQLEVLAMSSMGALRDARGQDIDFDRKMTAQRVLQEERDEVLLAIRRLDGFEHFLLPAPFEALRAAAEGGPIIMVNVSAYRCDALILRDAGAPTLVPLPDLSLDELRNLNGQFLKARGSDNSKQLVLILRTLWKKVVQPIVAKLEALAVPRNTRIWWCPTSFLCGFPLHAAGMYTKAEPDANLPNLFISSYTPTLSALIQARVADARSETPVQLLVIGQAADDLPAVQEEITAVQDLGAFVNTLAGEGATPLRVLSAMQQHAYMHFTCHASQRAAEPFKSAFCLHEGALGLLDIAQARLRRADFAFLSACETAAGDAGTPDEVIHLAAALQFAGFRSVVGTLWEMADLDGPFVAREFYGHLFRDGAEGVDFRDAAVALHGAMRALRKKEPQSVGRWINFIHVGA
ncbi:CHAT domain-containing protein [Mycena vulgaris]|nr:CHAT domain-containing protein [Mycena vulgaris]